jgi:hypothetical protein
VSIRPDTNLFPILLLERGKALFHEEFDEQSNARFLKIFGGAWRDGIRIKGEWTE